MLDRNEIDIINKNLEKGFDVEIQQRKRSIVIMKVKKDMCCKSDKSQSENKADFGKTDTI